MEHFDMAPKDGTRRTSTLSISLTPELAQAVSERVKGGLYTSASELIREALRLLLKTEAAERARMEQRTGKSTEALRFATTMELFHLGTALRDEKLRQVERDDAESDQLDRRRRLDEDQEAGPGLRVAPDRLEQLKLCE